MARSLISRLPFSPHIRLFHAATYLLGVALFSISFLVFLNSSVSFVLTDLLHLEPPIGDIVGTLGFADELVAIFAAPLWGVLSDGRLGTRGVVVCGYSIVFLSLIIFVNVSSAYPGLLLARMLFSVGAAAVATMVSAILPEMTASPPAPLLAAVSPAVIVQHTPTPSPPVDSEPASSPSQRHPTGKLAGLVGLFTGLGALLALGLFLPLPTHFAAQPGVSREDAVRRAFYTVALVAFSVGVLCLLGLPAAPTTRPAPPLAFLIKRWLWTRVWGGDPAALLPPPSPQQQQQQQQDGEENPEVGMTTSLRLALAAAAHDSRIALSYLGGFVARSTSVGIALFIPLVINHRFGACSLPGCRRRAYVLAAQLTGVSQLTALLLAPLFGYAMDHPPFGLHRNAPLVASAVVGAVGFAGFAVLGGQQGAEGELSWGAWVLVPMMGVGQIGGIVCSLGIMARGVVEEQEQEEGAQEDEDEELPLLRGKKKKLMMQERSRVKGGIAGVYSLCGGAGILALTKLGGLGFDRVAPGWPFWMLAGFEGMLAVGGLVEAVWGRRRKM